MDRFAVNTPFSKFKSQIGSEMVQDFEDPHFESELKNKLHLFKTYQMLKQWDEERKTPLTLVKPEKPQKVKARSYKTTRKNFVLTSKESLEEQENRYKNKMEELQKKEFNKKRRAAKKESKSVKKEEPEMTTKSNKKNKNSTEKTIKKT